MINNHDFVCHTKHESPPTTQQSHKDLCTESNL